VGEKGKRKKEKGKRKKEKGKSRSVAKTQSQSPERSEGEAWGQKAKGKRQKIKVKS
jgi:hypothetical protein